MQPEKLHEIDTIARFGAVLHEDDHLYREGDPFSAVYAVRSGVFKTYTLNGDGLQRVLGFHLPGELVGLDGIASNRYFSCAVALGTATACRFSFDALLDSARRFPDLQKSLLRLMSQEINASRRAVLERPAKERVVWFLLDFSRRLHERGQSATHFFLPMMRSDIANYLNITSETVSRAFSRLQTEGLIGIKQKELWLNDIPALIHLSSI